MEKTLRNYLTGIRKRGRIALLAALLVPVVGPSFAAAEVLAPVARHEKIGQLVTEFIQKSHYRHAAVDDDLSSLVLDRYIEPNPYLGQAFICDELLALAHELAAVDLS